MRRRLRTLALVFVAGVGVAAPVSHAQRPEQLNPVYLDASTEGRETLSRARELVSSGNVGEAARILQLLLDDEGSRTIQKEGVTDGEVHESVRAAVHRALLASPPLLERYRTASGPEAQRLLDAGEIARVRRAMLFTTSGFEAALREAQLLLEAARFEASRQVLGELEKHPDRSGAGGKAAAKLMTELSRYLDRPEVREVAGRWRTESGVSEGEARRIEWPDGTRPRGLTPLDTSGPLAREGLVSKPLSSAVIRSDVLSSEEQEFQSRRRRPGPGADAPRHLSELFMLPAANADSLFVSDGTTVRAYDRFTLSERWTISPGVGWTPEAPPPGRDAGIFNRWAQQITEPAFVTVKGDLVIACTGRSLSSSRGQADQIVTAIEARTGRLRWSVHLPKLDTALADSGIKGPAVVYEGVVLVSARKFLPERRLTVLSLLALDAETGDMLWRQTVGSAGSLPFVPTTSQFDVTAVHQGVAYRADDLGVVGAYRVFDGEPVWVRAMPRETMQTVDIGRAWELATPVIDESKDSLVMLTPDRRDVLRLNLADGKLAGRRGADALGSPLPFYLLKAGDRLVAVGRVRIGTTDLASFETAPARLTPPIGNAILGRVTVAGDRLLAPTVSGVAVIDPSRPEEAPETIDLDLPGNLLALESQLVAVDDGRMHSYLLWDAATRLLSDRIGADPTDATPAVTLAELGFRAGRHEVIAPAAEDALRAIDRDPSRESNQAARRRLMEALTVMVMSSLEGTGQGGSKGAAVESRITDPSVLSRMVEQLARAAATDDERAAQLLLAGQLAESRGEHAAAADMYQRILEDDALCTALWTGLQVQAPAGFEATRRLSSLVRAHGAGVYAAHDERAREALAALGPAPQSDALVKLTRRFPVSTIAPEAHLLLAQLRAEERDEAGALAALEEGLEAALASAQLDSPALSRLAGEVVTRMEQSGRIRGAFRRLERIRERFPTLVLTSGPLNPNQPGVPLELSRLESAVRQETSSERWPRVGGMTGTNAQVIAGAELLDPLIEPAAPWTTPYFAVRSAAKVVVYGADDSSATGALKPVWTRETERQRPVLLRADPAAAYFAYDGQRVGPIEKVEFDQRGVASLAWATEPLDDIFAPDEATRGLRRADGVMSDRFITPNEGLVQGDWLLFAMDDRTLVVLQRNGRAAAFDTHTGEKLWANRTGVNRVYDAVVDGGTLVVAGDQEVYSTGGRVIYLRGVMQVVDPRTGAMMQRLTNIGGAPDHPAWVRLVDRGRAIVGLESSVARIDLASGAADWVVTSGDAMPAATGWVLGDALVIQGQDRVLWRIDMTSGKLGAEALEAPRTHLEGDREIKVRPLASSPNAGFAVSTFQGLLVYGASGDLRGVDALGGFETMVPPCLAEGRAVTIETVADGPTPDGRLMFNMYQMDTRQARMIETTPIELGARPHTMLLMDGKVALTAGETTVILNAPPPPPPAVPAVPPDPAAGAEPAEPEAAIEAPREPEPAAQPETVEPPNP